MSIATRIQAIEEHISDAYDSLNKLGVTADNKNIENIAGLIDEIYDNTPKTDYISGTDLTLENTRVGKIDFKDTDTIEKIGLGVTSQQTYTGKNLLENTLTQSTNEGITFTSNSDGSVTANGTATGTALAWVNSDFTLPAGTYTLSGCPSGGSDSTYRLDINSSAYIDTGDGVTFTLSSETTIRNVRLRIANGYIANKIVFKPMIEKASAKTTYEPYTGGIAVPNPDNPQDINVVTGNMSIDISNKNLIEDETFVQGALNESTGTKRISCRNIKLKANTTYTLSSNLDFSIFNIEMSTSANQYPTSSVVYDSGWKTSNITFTTGQNDIYANIMVKKIGELVIAPSDVSTYYFQIEQGSLSTFYIPHQENNYEINLSSKNLFDKDDSNLIFNGFTDGSTGKLQSNTNARTAFIPCKPNTTYTISKILSARFNIAETSSSNISHDISVTILSASANVTSHTITTSANAKYLLIFYYLSTADTLTEEIIRNSIQIEIGNTATSYASYFTPIELCKINTYQDYIYKNNGNWFIHKEIGKVILDGTENWSIDRNVAPYVYRLSVDDYKRTNEITCFCSHYIRSANGTVASLSSGETHFRYYNDNLRYLYICDNRNLSIENFKTWLSNNNVTLYYVLNTPTETQITNENLIAQLDAWYNAQSMDDTTYITVDGDLPMQLKLRALKK